jgi:hypothetical protein
VTQSSSGDGTGSFAPEMLEALVSGLSTRSARIFTGWVGHHPAVLRDERPGLALVAGAPVDVRAIVWRSCGFRPIVPGQLPPRLRNDWVVQVHQSRVVAVATQFGADAVILGCDWITDPREGDSVESRALSPHRLVMRLGERGVRDQHVARRRPRGWTPRGRRTTGRGSGARR